MATVKAKPFAGEYQTLPNRDTDVSARDLPAQAQELFLSIVDRLKRMKLGQDTTISIKRSEGTWPKSVVDQVIRRFEDRLWSAREEYYTIDDEVFHELVVSPPRILIEQSLGLVPMGKGK